MAPRLLLALAVVLSGCSLSGGSDAAAGIALSSGTDSGECLGYCSTTLVVDGGVATLTYRGWTASGTLPDIEHRRPLNSDEPAALEAALDLDALRRAQAVYGCPDCADGGAEWVAAAFDGRTKRVTFDYGIEVAGLDAYIEAMRDLRARFPRPPRD